MLGANSSGKSALINSLLMLSQSADSFAISESPLRLNGNKTGMGETLNIIKDKDPGNKLSFSFDFGSRDVLRKSLSQVKVQALEQLETIPRWMNHALALNGVKSTAFARQLGKLESLFQNTIEDTKAEELKKHYIKCIRLYRSLLPKDKKSRNWPDGFVSFSEDASIQKIEDCIDTFVGLPLSRLVLARVTYTFSYNKRKEVLFVSEYVQHNKFGNVIFSYKKDGSNVKISSDVIDSSVLSRSRSEILRTLTLDSLQIAGGSNALNRVNGFGSFTGSASPVASCWRFI